MLEPDEDDAIIDAEVKQCCVHLEGDADAEAEAEAAAAAV